MSKKGTHFTCWSFRASKRLCEMDAWAIPGSSKTPKSKKRECNAPTHHALGGVERCEGERKPSVAEGVARVPLHGPGGPIPRPLLMMGESSLWPKGGWLDQAGRFDPNHATP